MDIGWLLQQFPVFQALTLIGRGGQKSVFSGSHSSHGDVVLKMFHLAANQERVLREIQAVKDMASPRVPQILDSGKLSTPMGEFLWVVEKRIPGGDVRKRLGSGRIPPADVLRLARQMLEVLAQAESARIVHRDVKPENILLDTGGESWLIDFGFARYLDKESVTATAAYWGVGTLGYAPPEQYRNMKDDIDARADLFALGVTLYECTEGYNPFLRGSRDAGETIMRIENHPLPRISVQVGADGQFSDMVLAMTRIRRDHRPKSCSEVLGWVREICEKAGV